MERLRHSEYARLLDFLAELHEPVAIEQFGKHLVRLSSGLLEGVTLSFDQIEESSGVYSLDHDYPLSTSEESRIFDRLREVYQQNPIYTYIRSGGRGPVVDISFLCTRGKFHRTEFYQDVFRPLGLEHQMNVLLSREGWINTLTVNRDKPIPARILTLFTLAAPHIALAHRNACRIADLEAAKVRQGSDILSLTRRESEVFHWLREGKRNGEIATILGCSPRTIDKHVENILRKSKAETRTAAVRHSLDC